MSDFETTKKRALNAFNACVKDQLVRVLAADRIISIEDDTSGSTVSALLDSNGTSDLLVNVDAQGLLFTAASRISFVAPKWAKLSVPQISMTLRNGIESNCDNTELNKLHRMVSAFARGIPAVLPRYLCMSQVDDRKEPAKLCELIAVETIPLINSIFNPADVNIAALRMRFAEVWKAEGEAWLASAAAQADAQKADTPKAPCVLLSQARPTYAGVRAHRSHTSWGSFFFFSREFLDERAIPYRRVKPQ